MIQSPLQPSSPGQQPGQSFDFSPSTTMRTSASTSSTGRLSGAELIRQLSYQKLESGSYRSDDSLYQQHYNAGGMGPPRGRPTVTKRFSDNYGPERPSSAARPAGQQQQQQQQRQARAKLIRQSTTAAADAAHHAAAGARRRQMAASRDQRSWRSCDVDHSLVLLPSNAGRRTMTREISPCTAARSMSGSMGQCDRINRQISCSTPAGDQASSSLDLTLSSRSLQPAPTETTPQKTPSDAPESRADEQQATIAVRYSKAKSAAEDDRVVLPPVVDPGVAVRIPAQVARTTKKVLRASGGRPAKARKAQSTRRIADRSSVRRPLDVEKSSEAEETLREQRRRARGIVILTSVVLLFICLFMVGFTLHLAPLIDNLVRKENEQQTSVASSSSSGVEFAMFNVTTPATPSAALPNATTSTLSSLSAAMFNVTKPSGAT